MNWYIGQRLPPVPPKAASRRAASAEWCAAKVMPQTDRQVVDDLTMLGLKTYSPQTIRWAKRGRQQVKIERPLFPGYVFVQADGLHHVIHDVPQVRGFVQSCDAPAVIPTRFIEAIKQAEAEHRFDKTWVKPKRGPHGMRGGDRVKVVAGPFEGFIGKIERLKGASRVMLMLSIFGGAKKIDADVEELELVA